MKKAVSRKERRKADRKLSKLKKDAWKRKVSVEDVEKRLKGPATEAAKPKAKSKKAKKPKKKGAGAEDRKRQRELAEADQAEVRRYAKKLGLHKRRRPGLPVSFTEAGLDYILDLCGDANEDQQKKKPKAQPQAPQDSGEEDDDEPFGDLEDELMDSEDAGSEADERIDSEPNEDGDETDSDDEEKEAEEEEAAAEDTAPAPAEPEKESEEDREREERLRRRIRGLLNRVSEATMAKSLKELLEVGRSGRRGLFKAAVSEAAVGAMSASVALPSRLVLEMGALVALLHSAHSPELSAHVLEATANALNSRAFANTPDQDSKAHLNLLRFLASLYLFRLNSAKLMVELMGGMVEELKDHHVESLLFLLRNLGLQLRKEVPEAFIALLDKVQTRMASEEGKALAETPKVRFMFQALQAVKNNNGTKLREKEWAGELAFEDEEVTHLRKVIRACLGSGGTVESPLKMGWDDLMEVEERGRWWIVGSAFTTGPNSVPTIGTAKAKPEQAPQSQEELDLLDLARRYRMNTELRRRIFVAVMSGEDYLDGVERALRLGLSGAEERELVNILLLCCLKEASYNAYYALCLGRLCSLHSRFRLSVQFALWDRLRELGEMTGRRRRQLALLMGSLVGGKSVRPSVLRTLEMAPMTPALEEFLGAFLCQALKSLSPEEVAPVFAHLVSEKQRPQCAHLTKGILLFVSSHLRPSLLQQPDAKDVLSKLQLLTDSLHQVTKANVM